MQMKKDLQKHMVESSNIEWVAYDKDAKQLFVMFKSGSVYGYEDVPSEIFDELLEAPSKGRYFALKIKWNYKYERLS
nr:hypothetical protein DGKKSRWO_DGKKSRWO_CDS_0178 [uncultured phage]CAI9752356.1 hypothetical protein CVNMHQAP_CVNMHQAP_CDS_0179 [uncultured phage]